jgi:hypothetical protein
MQHTLNPNGTRNREYRPYIAFEETTYNTSMYDPFRSVDYGLYSHGIQPGAMPAQLDVLQFEQSLTYDGLDRKLNRSIRPSVPRHLYGPHTSMGSAPHGDNGRTTFYKQLYAI